MPVEICQAQIIAKIWAVLKVAAKQSAIDLLHDVGTDFV